MPLIAFVLPDKSPQSVLLGNFNKIWERSTGLYDTNLIQLVIHFRKTSSRGQERCSKFRKVVVDLPMMTGRSCSTSGHQQGWPVLSFWLCLGGESKTLRPTSSENSQPKPQGICMETHRNLLAPSMGTAPQQNKIPKIYWLWDKA